MDVQEQLVWESEVSAAVLGNGEEFVLIRLDINEECEQAAIERAISKGFVYCGVLGFKNGHAAVRCGDDPGAIYTIAHASVAFAHVIAQHLRRQQGDAVDWLESLHSLPDTR